MDLASLQISIKETGAQKAIGNINSLRDSAKNLAVAINNLSKKLGRTSALYKGLVLIGEAAKIASTNVKTLQNSLDSIGVGKLSELAKATSQLTTATAKTSKIVESIKRDVEKTVQEHAKSAILEAKLNTERERGKKIVTQTLAIQNRSNQAIRNSVALTEANVSRINARTFMSTLKGNQQMAIVSARELKNNEIATERLKVATNNTTTSIIRQSTALNNNASSAARATLAQKRLERQNSVSNYHLKKHTQSWFAHWKSVATGIILYQGIRSGLAGVLRGFRAGIEAVDDFQVSAIQLGAILSTMAKGGDPIANFTEANRYAESLIPVLQKIDLRTSLNLQNLKDITLEMAKQGVVLDATNNKHVEGFTRIANAVALYSRNGQDTRQLQQEVRSALQGQTRDTDQLGKLLKNILGSSLKPSLIAWREQGVTIEKIGELLVGFGPANEKMSNTWSAATASIKTAFDIIAREALTPVLAEWVELIQRFNVYLIENKENIAKSIQGGWNNLKTTIKVVADNIWIAKTAFEAFVSVKMIRAIMDINKALIITRGTLISIGAVMAGEMIIATGGLVIALGGIVYTIDKMIERWEVFTNAYKLSKLAFKGEISLGDWITAGPQDAQDILDRYAINKTLEQSKDWSGSHSTPNTRLAGDWSGSVGAEIAPGVYTNRTFDEKTGIWKTSIYNPKENKYGVGKLGFDLNPPKSDEDTKALSKKIAFNNAQKRAEQLLLSLIDKESKYETIKDKSKKTLDEVNKLELLNQKYAKQGTVITEEQIVLAKKLIAENEKRALTQAAGGSEAVYQQLEDDLAEYDRFYNAGYIKNNEYNDKVFQSKLEASKKIIALDNSTFGIMTQALVQWSDSWSNTLNDMVWGAETSFTQILESFGQMITQMMIQKQFVDPIVGGLTNFATGALGSSGGTDYTGSTAAEWESWGFAKGGIMTSGGPMPLMSYASGGVANRPQVALFGEGAMAEAYVPLPDGRSIPVTMKGGEQSSVQNIKVEIVNQSNEELKATTTQTKQDASGTVLSIVIDGINRNKMGLRDIISQR